MMIYRHHHQMLNPGQLVTFEGDLALEVCAPRLGLIISSYVKFLSSYEEFFCDVLWCSTIGNPITITCVSDGFLQPI